MPTFKRITSVPVIQSAWSFLSAQNYLAILLMVLMVVAIRLPIDSKRMMTITDNDYTTHIYYALDMLHQREVPAFTLAHSFWQLLLIGTWWASRSRIDFWQSAIGFQVLSSIAAALILYFWYGALPGRPSPWKRVFWSVTLVIVTPVIFPSLLDGAYYFGYIGLANYHNPTVHMLRPFALIIFMFAMGILTCPHHTIWKILISAGVVAAATFLKPSYTLSLLPGLGLMVLYRLLKRKPVDWYLLVLGIGLPAVLILAAQFLVTYIQGEPEGGIAFMPFAAARLMSGFLGIKFFLSLLFPLAVLAVYRRRIFQDPEMVLAWLGFGAGAAQFYLFAERGSRATHGNFLWSAQITLFMLFAVTIRYLLKQEISWKQLARPQAWIPLLAYLPHILSGIAYYIFCYVTPHYG